MRKRRLRWKKLLFIAVFACLFLALARYAALFFLSRFDGLPFLTDREPLKYCLFIGKSEDAGGEADALILVYLDREAGKLSALSLSGLTNVAKEDEPPLLLKRVYSDGGAERTVSAVENLLHLRIDRYAVFDEERFASFLDSMGGLTYYVEQPMEHRDAAGETDISLRQGVQRLSGGEAYGYSRFLEEENGELGRLQRIERLCKALLRRSAENVRLFTWADAREAWQPVETNLTAGEAASALYDILAFPEENFYFYILPGELRTEGDMRFWEINPVDAQKTVGHLVSTDAPAKEQKK